MDRLIWKATPGWPAYEVSNAGDVRRMANKRPISPQLHRGYLRVQLWHDKTFKSVRINRLVCEAFNGPPPLNSSVAEHIDHDKQNNNPENIRWATQAENIRRSVRDGKTAKGERIGNAKLTDAAVAEIRSAPRRRVDCVALAQKFGVSVKTIYHVRSGYHWRHVG